MYNLTKDMFGPKKPKCSPLRPVDGTTLLTDKKDFHNSMSEHFSQLLNRESDVNFNIIDSIQQYDTFYHLDASPSFEEVGTAIEELSSGKCPGLDNIPPEVYKHGGVTLKRKLTPPHTRKVGRWHSSKGLERCYIIVYLKSLFVIMTAECCPKILKKYNYKFTNIEKNMSFINFRFLCIYEYA